MIKVRITRKLPESAVTPQPSLGDIGYLTWRSQKEKKSHMWWEMTSLCFVITGKKIYLQIPNNSFEEVDEEKYTP